MKALVFSLFFLLEPCDGLVLSSLAWGLYIFNSFLNIQQSPVNPVFFNSPCFILHFIHPFANITNKIKNGGSGA